MQQTIKVQPISILSVDAMIAVWIHLLNAITLSMKFSILSKSRNGNRSANVETLLESGSTLLSILVGLLSVAAR